jgi:hypothetical protein
MFIISGSNQFGDWFIRRSDKVVAQRYYDSHFETNLNVKLTELPVPDCSINTIFTDSVDKEFDRMEYCIKNCRYACIKGKEYKRS